MDDLPVHLPRPSHLPKMPSEADLERAERQLELTENRSRSTMRPKTLRQDRQNIKRTIARLQAVIDSGQLEERDLYDAIVNLHLLSKVLSDSVTHSASMAQRVVVRYRLRANLEGQANW